MRHAPVALLVALAVPAGPLAAQSVTTPRFATTVGGFMNLAFGYVDSAASGAEGGNPFVVVNDAEVILNFRLVADNGLTFGAKVEFEANGSSANVDEYVGWVQGGFGRVEVGAEDGAADILGRGVPGGTFSGAATDDGFLFDHARTGVVRVGAIGADTGDALKLTYYTPSFSGFRAGISAAPNESEGPVASSVTTTAGRGLELGAQYRGEFSGVGLRINAGTTIFDEGASVAVARDYAFTVGTSVSFAGFEAGVTFGQTDADNGTDQSIGFGLAYSTGPWWFGAQFAQRLDARPTEVRAGVFETFDDSYGVSAEVMYRLAPGVTTGVVIEHASDSFTTTGPYTGTDSAYAGGLYLMMSF